MCVACVIVCMHRLLLVVVLHKLLLSYQNHASERELCVCSNWTSMPTIPTAQLCLCVCVRWNVLPFRRFISIPLGREGTSLPSFIYIRKVIVQSNGITAIQRTSDKDTEKNWHDSNRSIAALSIVYFSNYVCFFLSRTGPSLTEALIFTMQLVSIGWKLGEHEHQSQRSSRVGVKLLIEVNSLYYWRK